MRLSNQRAGGKAAARSASSPRAASCWAWISSGLRVVVSSLPAGVGASVGDCVVGLFGSSVPVVAKIHSISDIRW